MRISFAFIVFLLAAHMYSCMPSATRNQGDKRPYYCPVYLDVLSFKNVDVYRMESKEGNTYIIYNLKCDTTALHSHKSEAERIRIGKWYPLDLELWDVAPAPEFRMYLRGGPGKIGAYVDDSTFNLEFDSIIDGMVTGRISLPVYHSPDLCGGYIAVNDSSGK